jgi:FkbM family methyltransferase
MVHLREANGLLMLGTALAKVLPRGKGAVVRFLGRRLISPEARYMLTRHNAKLVLSPDALDVYSTMRARGNAWDYADFEVCYAITVDGGVFYEIGSNVGYFAIEMIERSNGRVRVIAFEPQDSLVTAIECSKRINRHGEQLTVVNALVGDRDGDVKFFLAPATIHSSAVNDSNRPVRSVISKTMVSLDRQVSDSGMIPPDSIKLDVEGSEHLVFRGAYQVLRETKPHIYLEYHQSDDPGGRIRSEIDGLMRDTGCYDLYASPNVDRRALYPQRLYRISPADDWNLVDSILMLNRQRAVRGTTLFSSAGDIQDATERSRFGALDSD